MYIHMAGYSALGNEILILLQHRWNPAELQRNEIAEDTGGHISYESSYMRCLLLLLSRLVTHLCGDPIDGEAHRSLTALRLSRQRKLLSAILSSTDSEK